MRIALDATYSFGPHLSGVGVYSRELMRVLAQTHPESTFHYCYRPHRFFRSFSGDLPPNCRRRLLGLPDFSPVFHGLNQRLPSRPRFRRMVSTFHDLFVMTGDYSTPDFRARFTAQARDAAARSDHIIAVSAFTARQVETLLGVEPSRITVVHHGIRALAPSPATRRERIVLHTGAIQRRKNLIRLIAAFERFASLDEGLRLVLAGSAGFGAEEILERIETSPRRAAIEVTGYVTDAALADWYARASIFAFPSLDEGFGIPLLEAMAAEVPIVTSNRSALPEVAGEAALVIDPEDTDAMAQALRGLATDTEQRELLIARGRKRAAAFTWETAGGKTWEVYQQLG